MDAKRLGSTMQRRRVERGLTPLQLAGWCEVEERSITTLEDGTDATPDLSLLGRIAEALGYPSALAMLTDPGDARDPDDAHDPGDA